MLREAVKSISDANQNGHISCLKNVAVKQIFDDERFNLRQYLLFCLSTLLSLSHPTERLNVFSYLGKDQQEISGPIASFVWPNVIRGPPCCRIV